MQRRKFIRNLGLGVAATGLLPSFAWANNSTASSTLVSLGEPLTQIRHGALNLPIAVKHNRSIPFSWMTQIQRNIFFGNGFQRNETSDLEIVSVLLKEEEELEAVQIQIGREELLIMIENNIFTVSNQEVFYQLPHQALHIQLIIGNFEQAQEHQFILDSPTSVFVQPLSGLVNCNGHSLQTHTGLAISNTESLDIFADQKSQVLFLCRKE